MCVKDVDMNPLIKLPIKPLSPLLENNLITANVIPQNNDVHIKPFRFSDVNNVDKLDLKYVPFKTFSAQTTNLSK